MSDAPLRCSFCNKDQNDVRKLIAGPNVYICDECIKVCVDIVNDDPYVRKGGERVVVPPLQLDAHAEWRTHSRCALCGMPMPAADTLLIPERGPLCVGCVGEIEAAIAGRTPGHSEH